jgi:hypothetical protein
MIPFEAFHWLADHYNVNVLFLLTKNGNNVRKPISVLR